MSDIDVDLNPSDGLSNIWIKFDSVRYHHRDQWDVSFRIFHATSEEAEQYMATITFPVRGTNEFYEAVSLAHDDLIDFLRQALYVSNMMRQSYRNSAERHRQPQS